MASIRREPAAAPRKEGSAAEVTAAAIAECHNKCEREKEYSLTKSAKVRYLMDSIKKLGCELPDDFIKCKPCKGLGTGTNIDIGAGFQVPTKDGVKPQVVICEDSNFNNATVDQDVSDSNIAHELIHAYDHCRTKASLKGNCMHIACSEVRASNMSGECAFTLEYLRGNFGVYKQHRACVMRRAKLSLEGHEACKAKADEYLDATFEACYKDPAPFYGPHCY